ncbi:ATP-dependent nuclease [Archangium gephyra]|uniref:ATP-dependent nuclease n=1 Tax=Archangium gephyra TaxID=48 RepID=UPI003B7EA477
MTREQSSEVTFTSIHFENFKALVSYRVPLQRMNVLVGANNSGKSTVIAAFRALAAGLRAARARSPTPHEGPDERTRWGWSIPVDELPISVENVHSDYNDRSSTVTFQLSNKNRLLLWFPADGGCFLFHESEGAAIQTPSAFRKAFPVTVGVVPVLGPVEHEERLVEPETVTRGLATHRASRHFRSFWHHFPEQFEEFAALVRETWPGMEINSPEQVVRREGARLFTHTSMFCREERIDRELYWVGFGFQIWCQLLTHIVRNRAATLLVLDEPETYLHPDVQRKLLGLLRQAGPDIMLATHSSEIIAEAEPNELLLINKRFKSAHRVSDADGVQKVLEAVGSIQNPTLTHLARTRRVLFVEGEDFRILRRFARRLGLGELSNGNDLTVVPIGGFANWEKVVGVGWGIGRTLGRPLSLSIVLDRDYRADAEIEDVRVKLAAHLQFVHLHQRKEVENYLLVTEPLARAASAASRERARRTGVAAAEIPDIQALLMEIAGSFQGEVLSQYLSRRQASEQRGGIDAATAINRVLSEFHARWSTFEGRMELVPGKRCLAALNQRLQEQHKIQVTATAIIDAFHIDEVPVEVRDLLAGLDAFRQRTVPSGENPAQSG